jgi:protein gp37
MAGPSKIEWCTRTWNPFVGCAIVSPGCRNCYAMGDAYRKGFNPLTPHYHGLTRRVNGHAVWTGAIALASEKAITAPLRWRRTQRIFVNSMGDVFYEAVPEAWIDRVFAIMAASPQHVFQVLTKRPDRMRAYSEKRAIPDHVWLGASAEDQDRYDERWPILKAVKAKVRFLSLEPLLGPIRLDWAPEWVIAGGESGRGFRPMDAEWARALRDACIGRTAFFMKQMSGAKPLPPIPADLAIREFPLEARLARMAGALAAE